MLYHNQIVIAAYGLESLIGLAKPVTDAREHLFGNSLMLWDQWEGPETFLAVYRGFKVAFIQDPDHRLPSLRKMSWWIEMHSCCFRHPHVKLLYIFFLAYSFHSKAIRLG